MLIVIYIAFIYFREQYAYKVKKKEIVFELLLFTGIFSIAFDGITAYTVNRLNKVPVLINDIFHACFLCSLDAIVLLIFLYIMDITRGLPKKRKARIFISLPFAVNMAAVILFMPKITYCHGEITNYSMGIPVYTCYIMVAVYMLGSVMLLVRGRKNMGHNKLITITTCIVAALAVTVYQMIHPQALLTSLVSVFVIIGAYLNMENPLLQKLSAHNKEMVMGFATLVENRDGSTGGHIRRTTTYVEMLAKELKNRGLYKDELTAEEFDVMKTHAAKGGEIIKETFQSMGDDEYEKIAYQVARFHHEKWNGKGYPEGLSRKEIPLCARIMAVADVFDAVSAKRCYRDAMPLEQCFSIIENGSGQDFDPYITDVFLDMKEMITNIVESNGDAGN